MTQQDCIIYTAKPSKRLVEAGNIAAAYLNKTPGRHINITWRKVKALRKVPISKPDADGEVRIDWLWLRSKFGDLTHELVGYHFTPADRKRFKLTTAIDGSSHLHMGVGFFYLCANPSAKAAGYDDLPEVAQLIIHEISHYDTKITGAPWFLTHHFEKRRKIHELPALIAYDIEGELDRLAVTAKQLYAAATA